MCRYVLADATQHSLVLVDELGKGTEVSAGAAIAGALLEALDAVGCKARSHSLLSVPTATLHQRPTFPLPARARGILCAYEEWHNFWD